MKKLNRRNTAFLLLLIVVTLMSFTVLMTDWKILEEQAITFQVKYMFGQTCHGSVSGLTGKIDFDPKQPEKSTFDVMLPISSIKTGNSKRDKHLQQKEYFNAATFPSIQFKSTQVTKTSSGFLLTGNLIIKGITKSVSIPFTFKNNDICWFEGDLTINRLDYGVGKKSFLLKNNVSIHISVPVGYPDF
jgi:polyisoprenoid-binding protein YceI